MINEIEAGGATTSASVTGGDQRSLVPMKVGSATVYVVQTGEVSVVADDEIYTVSPDPREVFDRAIDVIRECVAKIGEGVGALAEKAMPRELTVEFSLTFEAKGKTAILPIFVTAEHGVGAGLKISAVWKRGDVKLGGKSTDAEDPAG